jgi:ATP-dependent RNA helicase DeaD
LQFLDSEAPSAQPLGAASEAPPLSNPETKQVQPAPGGSASPTAPAPRRRPRGPGKGARPVAQPSRPATETALSGEPASLSKAFRLLGVEEIGLSAVAALGFEQPTPIQEAAIPLLLDGRDLVGIAQTGTGKTLAFGLPLARTVHPQDRNVQALVLVPTRELANQVREVLQDLGRSYGFTTLGLFGGRNIQTDLSALRRGVQVVVGTPGRVIDHLKRRSLSLDAIRFVVLDEADQMLDIGFAQDIEYILRAAPADRQTALFSATMPASIERLAHRYMRRAGRVSVAPEQRTAEGVSQYFYEVSEREKFTALRHLCESTDVRRSLIFRRTKHGVDRLTQQLKASGVQARAIHGDLRQSERDRVLAEFRSGRLEFLVATNVAARGLDIPDIDHVINYDVPQNPEEYIHRIGRTARAGKKGSAVTFVGEWEFEDWDRIVGEMGREDLQHLRLPLRL